MDKNYKGESFDLIFADAWPGKYSEVEEILELINIGGLYIIDDILTQANWPDGHQENVDKLIQYLENRKDFNLTKMNWSTGIIIATKKYKASLRLLVLACFRLLLKIQEGFLLNTLLS